MSLIKQIKSFGTVCAWSPFESHASYMACGVKAGDGGGFDAVGGELHLMDLDISKIDVTPTNVGIVKDSQVIKSIAWGKVPESVCGNELGLIATGSMNGDIKVYNPSSILTDPTSSCLAEVKTHQGPVNALDFNPNEKSEALLASGGSDKNVFVIDLNKPSEPTVYSPGEKLTTTTPAEITCVAWNSKVSHILGNSTANGVVTVWDLRSKAPWCELKDVKSSPISQIAWNPEEGLRLVTASDDDNNPVIKFYDLRSSPSTPILEFQGHTKGVLSLSWCPFDTSFIVSCGKDNKTFLWNTRSTAPIYEIPVNQSSSNNNNNSNSYDPFSSALSGRRYQVNWSPCIASLLSSCSMDSTIAVHSVNGTTESGFKQAPNWLKCGNSVKFGFGGKLVYFNNKDNNSRIVKVRKTAADSSLKEKDMKFQEYYEKNNLKGYCEEIRDNNSNNNKSGINSDEKEVERVAVGGDNNNNSNERDVWNFLCSLYEPHLDRNLLLQYLGIDMNGNNINDNSNNLPIDEMPNNNNNNNNYNETIPILARKALVTSNITESTKYLMEMQYYADALFLASFDKELFTEVQQKYLEYRNSPLLQSLYSLASQDYDRFIEVVPLDDWKEAFSLICAYGQPDQFSPLCSRLGSKLEMNNDYHSALLCYLSALDIENTIKVWLNDSNGNELSAVQDLLEKIIIAIYGVRCQNPRATVVDNDVIESCFSLAMLLAGEGLTFCGLVLSSFFPEFIRSNPMYDIFNPQQQQQQQQRQQPQQQPVHQPQQQPIQPQRSQYPAKPIMPTTSYPNPNNRAPAIPIPQYIPLQPQQPMTTTPMMPITNNIGYNTTAGTSAYRTEKPNTTRLIRPPVISPILPSPSITTPTTTTPMMPVITPPQFQPQYQPPQPQQPQQPQQPPQQPQQPVVETPSGPPLQQHTVEMLTETVESLKTCGQNPIDKGPYNEGCKAINILFEKSNNGLLDEVVVDHLANIIASLEDGDVEKAMSIYAELKVSNEWDKHKDWMKGFKYILMLSKKYFFSQ